MDALEVFNEHRPLLFSVAYRMLGSGADAQDLVQESYLRWRSAPHASIESPKAYLMTLITRLAIDQLRSAQARREEYVGSWLPEPVVEAQLHEPAELAESLSMAFLLLLERLAPVERAVFLLKEIFDYDYHEIAEIVGKSEDNCRQIVVRSRKHLKEDRPRFDVARTEHQAIVQRFLAACQTGDMPALLALLKQDITLFSDGGGKVRAALNPIYGNDRVARFILGISGKELPDFSLQFTTVNAQPGVIFLLDGHVHSVMAMAIADGIIHAIYIVSNPDKLQMLERLRR